jgi:glycosyltransferase involved in cell wall biosynthesis
MVTNCRVGESIPINGLVSVIIPTKNSERTIHFTLQSLRNQTYKRIEIIVVDNFSTDMTCQIAKRYGARVFIKGQERAEQLQYGSLRAKGEFLYFTGSDLVIDPTYIEEAVHQCRYGYEAIYASVVSKHHNNFWCRVKELERKSYIGTKTESARFINKSVFFKIGGIDTKLISVEEDLQHRLDINGYKTGRIKATETHLHEATSLREISQKSYYYGMYIRTYLRKYPIRGTKFLFPLRPAFFKNFMLFVKHPLLTVGFVIYKVVQYVSGFLGMLSQKKEEMNRKLYEKDTLNHPTA